MANEINQIKVGSTTYTLQDSRVDSIVTGVSSVNSKTGDVSLGASDVGALSLDGGTINKSKTVKMDASANSNGANLKWGTVNSKNPYIGYASDQTDGTFVIGSLLGTNYASGLAIGGGSGNLLWKGAKVATTNDIPNVSGKANLSGGNTFSGQQIFQNTNSGAVAECVVNNTAWDSFAVRSVSDNTQKTAISNGYVWCQDSDTIYSRFNATGIYYGNDTSGYEGTLKFPTNISGEKTIATTSDVSGKLDKTTYEVNKTINFGSSGVLCVGKFKVYDTNVTCEITSTTSVTYSGKLVIATQNNVIQQMTVYGDAANTVAPNFFIKPSTTSDPYIEVYFKPAGWSKNVVHIYGSAIEAEPTNVCTNVSAVPSTATSKPTNALNSKANLSDIPTYADRIFAGTGQQSVSIGKNDNTVDSTYSIAIGGGNSVTNSLYSAAIGNGNTITGSYSIAVGDSNTASGDASVAMGYSNTASGKRSFAMGYSNESKGEYSIALGYSHIVSGNGSVSLGYNNETTSSYATAMGYNNKAGAYQTVIGRRATTTYEGPSSSSSTSGSLFIIGKGTGASALSNAFRVTTTGAVYGAAAYNSSGADYAEMWEWEDGNPNNEDRRGKFVTVDENNKIRIATTDDEYILGIISATPCVVGDVESENWKDMYLKDVFGQPIVKKVDVPEHTDEETGELVKAHTEEQWVLNPEYDPTRPYVSRDERKEWATVGLMGKLVVIDDGTCVAGRYCKLTDKGTATSSADKNDWRVLKRMDSTHVQILYR